MLTRFEAADTALTLARAGLCHRGLEPDAADAAGVEHVRYLYAFKQHGKVPVQRGLN